MVDDGFSDTSSFVSESICSTFTDINPEQGVEVFRSKMNKRRKRASKKVTCTNVNYRGVVNSDHKRLSKSDHELFSNYDHGFL